MASPKKDAGPVYKKRNLDFTDYAYREAVNKLKFLLAESYGPSSTFKSNSYYHRHPDDSDDTDNASIFSKTIERPVLSDISKYLPSTRYSTLKKYLPSSETTKENLSLKPIGNIQQPSIHSQLQHQYVPPKYLSSSIPNIQSSNVTEQSALITPPPPPELLNFIEKQEGYIEQLEKESQFCRDELNNLLCKVKDVISENEMLTDQARSSGTKKSYFQDSSESDLNDTIPDTSKYPLQKCTNRKLHLEGPNIVFESRISELEAQLAQANIDLKRITEENDTFKRKTALGLIDTGCSDVYKKQIENLQRDKQTLEESVRKLQQNINEFKESDVTNFAKTQLNRELIDQHAFEKAQANIEIKRLKEELERQHVRVREIQHEMTKKIAEERSNAERRYNYQVDQLGGDLTSQWEVASRLQLELERYKRLETDYRRDIAQKNAQIDELKSELKTKSATFLSDVAQMNAEKQSLEQEITSLRLQLERADRQAKVESSRLNAEIISLRQRLDRADADLLHSRRENLRLCDQVSSLEKEIALGDLNREPRPSNEITKLMNDMETKHAATVSDLENMVQGQKQLMEKLTAECKSLTKKLEDTTVKHKHDKDSLRKVNNELMERLRQLWTSYKETIPAFKLLHGSTSTDSEECTKNNDDQTIDDKKMHKSTTKSIQNHNKKHQEFPITMTPNTQPIMEMNIQQTDSKQMKSIETIHHNHDEHDNHQQQTTTKLSEITNPMKNIQKKKPRPRSKSQEPITRNQMNIMNTIELVKKQCQLMMNNNNNNNNKDQSTIQNNQSKKTELQLKNMDNNHKNCMTQIIKPIQFQNNYINQNMMDNNMTTTILNNNNNNNNTLMDNTNNNNNNNNYMIPINNSIPLTEDTINNMKIPIYNTNNNIPVNTMTQQITDNKQQQHQQQTNNMIQQTHHHFCTPNKFKAIQIWQNKSMSELSTDLEQQNNNQLHKYHKHNTQHNNNHHHHHSSTNKNNYHHSCTSNSNESESNQHHSISSSSNNHRKHNKNNYLDSKQFCRNSLPRKQITTTSQSNNDFLPEVTISSPSLFDTGSETSSPTLSPAVTVHKLY